MRKDIQFVMFPKWIVENGFDKISSKAVKVLVVLSTYSHYETHCTSISISKIEKISGLSDKTVKLAIAELEDLKIISRTKSELNETTKTGVNFTPQKAIEIPEIEEGGVGGNIPLGSGNIPLRGGISTPQSIINNNNYINTKTIANPSDLQTLAVKKSVKKQPQKQPQNDTPYQITTPLQKTVTAWKIITGHKKEDRAWDKLNFARTAKTAKLLLDYFDNDLSQTVFCIEDIYAKMKKANLTCTIETVAKHASEWRIENENYRHKQIAR